jgi:hypothetical protein
MTTAPRPIDPWAPPREIVIRLHDIQEPSLQPHVQFAVIYIGEWNADALGSNAAEVIGRPASAKVIRSELLFGGLAPNDAIASR